MLIFRITHRSHYEEHFREGRPVSLMTLAPLIFPRIRAALIIIYVPSETYSISTLRNVITEIKYREK